ncbi:MAG: hypothetical protein P4L27_03875 [Ignavibacteriaceae bacterium]|nr:hypothetical protein [Ignavibacteriaceae bacterium]
MKKLFTNYNFEFDKSEKRLISTFLKQSLKQIEGDNKFFAESKSFQSILDKINSNENPVKLTKDERTRLKYQIENNLKFLQKRMSKAWFIKKWLYKSMLIQYNRLLENHFKG